MFIAADLSKSRQKLLSHFQVDIGNLASQGSKTITFNVISLIEGTIDLAQTISYHTSNGTVSASKKSSQIAIVPGEASTMPTAAQATQATSQQRKPNHNISIEYANDTVIKMKKDNIVIPCTAEFLFTGKFYSLSKEPLTKLFQGEDFLFRVDLEVKSVDIDILDMFLISVSVNRQYFATFFSIKTILLCRITISQKSRMANNDANMAKLFRKANEFEMFAFFTQPKPLKTG